MGVLARGVRSPDRRSRDRVDETAVNYCAKVAGPSSILDSMAELPFVSRQPSLTVRFLVAGSSAIRNSRGSPVV